MSRLKAAATLNFMIGLTLTTQLVSLYKSSLMAKFFGTGMQIGAFYFVSNLSGSIINIIGGAVTTLLIPQIIKKNNTTVSIFVNYLTIVTLLSAGLFLLAEQPIIQILSGSKSPIFVSYCVSLSTVTLLSNIFLLAVAYFSAIAQANNSFNFTKIAQLISNLFIVIALNYFKNSNVHFFSYLYLSSAIINALLFIFDRKHINFGYTFSFNYRDKQFIKIIRGMPSFLVASGVYQVSLVIDYALCSRINVASITLLNFSTQIAVMVSILFSVNIINYIYPQIIRDLESQENSFKLEQKMNSLSQKAFLLLLLIVICYGLVGKILVKLMLVHGNFSASSGYQVFITSLILLMALPFGCIRDFGYRLFYASEDVVTPMINAVLVTLINVGSSIILAHYIGVYGVVLGTFLAAVFSAIRMSLICKQRLKINMLTQFRLLAPISLVSYLGLCFLVYMLR